MLELAFGSLTYNIEKSLMIKLTNTGRLAITRQNSDFSVPLTHAK